MINSSINFFVTANANIQTTKLGKFARKIKKKTKLKNLNIAKKIKKRTKRGRHKKHFTKNFKGKVINGTHELYTLTVGMMFGLRCTVGKEENEEELSLEDFNYVEKRDFLPEGSVNKRYRTPEHSLGHTFKFKSYSPKVFKRLRDFYDIDTASYMHSVCGNFNYLEFISNSKSGQFFFYSHDGKYMVKTQTKEENRFMKRILPHYFRYVTENPHSMMVRFLGMHRVKMHHLRRKVHFVIMASVFDTPVKIHQIYDLKGSMVGREASQKDRETGGVLKDKDLLKDGKKFHLGNKKEDFVRQIERDAMFLADMNIMDYSLLIGIHDRSRREEDALEAEAIQAAGEDIPTRSNTPFREGRVRSMSLGSIYPNALERGENDAVAAAEYLEKVIIEDMKESNRGESSKLTRAIGDNIRNSSSKHSSLEVDTSVPLTGHFTDKRPASLTYTVSTDATSGSALPGSAGVSPARRRSSTNSQGGGAQRRGSGPGRSPINSGKIGAGRRNSIRRPSVQPKKPESDNDDDDDDDGENDENDDDYDEEYDEENYDGDEGDSDYEELAQSPRLVFQGIGAPEHQLELPTKSSFQKYFSQRSSSKSARKSLSKEAMDSQRIENVLGMGVVGREGKAVASIFKKSALVDALSELNSERMLTSIDTEMTYGPGVAPHKPWTLRMDGGINSRIGNVRGDDIYYCGVIDILQQFNSMKSIENKVKSVYLDAKMISCVDAKFYAQRFVKFLRDNID
jgi:hypothetical protein